MLKFKWIKITLMALAVILGMNTPSAVLAAENGALNYPAGSPAVFIGEFPPIPGLFAVSQTSYTASDSLYDANGDKIEDQDFELVAWVETFRFLVSYPYRLWGANLYSQLVLPLVSVESSLTISTPYGPYEAFDDSDSGLANIAIAPVILNWHQPESYQYITFGVDFVLYSGASYDEENSVNAATGYNTIMPQVAYRYDDPNGFDLGFKANLMFNLENGATNYDTGDMLVLDLLAGWNVGKWKLDIVGGYTHQYASDQKNGNDVNNSKLRSLNMGPSITYSAGPLIVNVNYQKGLLAENSSMNDTFWLNIALPLYVPNPPMPK